MTPAVHDLLATLAQRHQSRWQRPAHLEDFLSLVDHLDGFLQIQIDCPARPMALVTGSHGAEYKNAVLGALARRFGDATSDRFVVWTEALGSTHTGAQWGMKLSCSPHAPVQLYVRGRFSPTVVAEAAKVFGLEVSEAPLRRICEGLSKTDVRLAGLELQEDEQHGVSGRAVGYVTAACRSRQELHELRDAIGGLIHELSLTSRAAEAWHAVAPDIITSTDQTLFVSAILPSRSTSGQLAPRLKIDAGARRTAALVPLAKSLGHTAQDVVGLGNDLAHLAARRTEQTGITVRQDVPFRLSAYVRVCTT